MSKQKLRDEISQINTGQEIIRFNLNNKVIILLSMFAVLSAIYISTTDINVHQIIIRLYALLLGIYLIDMILLVLSHNKLSKKRRKYYSELLK